MNTCILVTIEDALSIRPMGLHYEIGKESFVINFTPEAIVALYEGMEAIIKKTKDPS